MKRTVLTVGLALLFLNPAMSAEVANVNGVSIDSKELDGRYQAFLAFSPGTKVSKREFLERIIDEKLGANEARKKGLQNHPNIEPRVNALLAEAYLDSELGADLQKIHVTDQEAKRFYSKNPTVRIRHIFIQAGAGATKEQLNEARKRARETLLEVKKAKRSFAAIAREKSEDPVTAINGGDLGYRALGELPPEVYSVASRLRKPGEVSHVVESAFGFHLIQLMARKPWHDADVAQAKRTVFEQKRAAMIKEHLARLRRSSNVKIQASLTR